MSRFVARWDLDKTYLRTDFDTLRDLVRTALERADQKRTVPGAASLLRELSTSGAEIHILSGSPRQMRSRIEEKLRLDGARFETLTLKPNLENFLRFRLRAIRDQLGYKLPALLKARATMREQHDEGRLVREVLLGDDAEADAFVYSIYADVLAGKIDDDTLGEIMRRGRAYEEDIAEALRYARLVEKGDVVERILIHLERVSRPSRFRAYGPRVVPFYNYLQAAFVLAEDGRIGAASVVRVAAELVIDHRFDADGLARSYLDLRRRGSVRGDLGPSIREAAIALEQPNLPAIREVRAMCDLLDVELPKIAPPAPPPPPTADYLALVAEHNPRRRRDKTRLGGGCDLLDPLRQRRRGQRAHLRRHRPPLREPDEQRDAPHLVRRRHLRVFVDVELRDQDATGEVLREILEDGADHPAGAAPRRPEIHHDRQRRLLEEAGQLGVGRLERVGRRGKRLLALAALRGVPETGHGHSISLPTAGAADDELAFHEGDRKHGGARSPNRSRAGVD